MYVNNFIYQKIDLLTFLLSICITLSQQGAADTPVPCSAVRLDTDGLALIGPSYLL